MKNTKILGLIPIMLLLFSVLFFIYNIEDCATDEEILQNVFMEVKTEDDETVEQIEHISKIPIQVVEHDGAGYIIKEENLENDNIIDSEGQQVVEDVQKEEIQLENNKGENELKENIHTHNKQTIRIAPTCYNEGEEKVICESCNFVFERKKIAKLIHDWEYICEDEATPEQSGKILYRCNICFDGKEVETKFDVVNKTKLYVPALDLSVDIQFTECNQENTDKYDVCCDMDFINENNPLFWGHNNRTMKNLHKIKVGDIIYFVYNNKVEKYVVTISEEGYKIDGGTNIMGKKSEIKCISKCENKTLHFFTCYQTPFNPNGRWIVLAEKV